EQRDSIDSMLRDLMPQIDSDVAHACAREWSRLAAAEPDLNQHGGETSTGTHHPLAILADNGRAQPRRRRTPATWIGQPMVETTGSDSGGARAASSEPPLPCRLTTPELVALLKMPTCYGPARRLVLNHLGNRYGRRFANHWAFVRFAREQNLGLDFT